MALTVILCLLLIATYEIESWVIISLSIFLKSWYIEIRLKTPINRQYLTLDSFCKRAEQTTICCEVRESSIYYYIERTTK
jgi:hypothetical protein